MSKSTPSRPPIAKAKRTFHIVASRFNAQYVDGLIDHVTEELRALAPNGTISLHRVPWFVRDSRSRTRSCDPKQADAIIACGVILQGETNHAQNLSRSVTDALQRIAIEHGVPVINAVLSFDNENQARARCLENKINRGTEAARAAVEIANVLSEVRRNKEGGFERRDMGKRRRAREAAVQYHFWRDLQRGEGPDKIDEFWEFCPAPERVREFAQPLIEGMVAHLPEIDERIRRYCENYEFRRISAVDRNVLRLAIYEMLYRDDIPPVVSINEAIELAKAYGGADSGRFVNGILDRIRKDLDRPAREPVKKEL